MDVDGGGSGGGGGGGGVHVVGVSLSFKGEPGKPIQIAYRGGVGGGGVAPLTRRGTGGSIFK